MLDKLKASAKQENGRYPEEFDLLIVGGGATGAGVAVDAVSRGLKVALVERADFSSGELSHCVASELSVLQSTSPDCKAHGLNTDASETVI